MDGESLKVDDSIKSVASRCVIDSVQWYAIPAATGCDRGAVLDSTATPHTIALWQQQTLTEADAPFTGALRRETPTTSSKVSLNPHVAGQRPLLLLDTTRYPPHRLRCSSRGDRGHGYFPRDQYRVVAVGCAHNRVYPQSEHWRSLFIGGGAVELIVCVVVVCVDMCPIGTCHQWRKPQKIARRRS